MKKDIHPEVKDCKVTCACGATFTTKSTKEELHIEADGQKILLHVENIYPVFHLGINACEGINRFYTLSIS